MVSKTSARLLYATSFSEHATIRRERTEAAGSRDRRKIAV